MEVLNYGDLTHWMEEISNQVELLETNFDREIRALISVMAEICVHEFLTQTQQETKNVETK